MVWVVTTPLLLIGSFCLGIISGLEWETAPEDYVYACVGSKVTLPWRFKAASNETVLSVNWIYDGSLSSAMVATLVHSNFVPTSGYSARVRHVQNAGLVLEDLFTEDSGNYTVEVNVAVTGGLFRSLRKSAHLQVADGMMLEGELTADQDAEAWWNQTAGQWLLHLTCGYFTFLGPPPVDVVWTTPKGETKTSSGYESGHFYLSLTTPVRGGNYTCSIPPARLPDLCFKNPDARESSAVSAAVSVDEAKARMSLLEANQKTLREDRERLLANQKTMLEASARLQDKVQRLELTHAQDMQNMTEYCRDSVEGLKDQVDHLYKVQQTLMEKVETLELRYNDTQHTKEASMSGPCLPGSHTVLDDSWRSTSEAVGRLQCDKDLDPGWYRFLLRGDNAVMPTECVPKNHCNTHAPQWLNLDGQSLPPVGGEAEGRACAHWSGGCCHWESPVTVRNCGPYYVYHLRPGDDCHLAYCVKLQE